MEYLQPWLKKIRCVRRDYSQHGDQQQLPKIETKIRWIRFQISWLETDKTNTITIIYEGKKTI